jgi:hypothetical protein
MFINVNNICIAKYAKVVYISHCCLLVFCVEAVEFLGGKGNETPIEINVCLLGT